MPHKRSLIVSCNPDPLCIAVDAHLAQTLRSTARVDAVNLNRIVDRYHPTETVRDRLYERFDRKYERFVAPRINGLDQTRRVNVGERTMPALPETVRELRVYKREGVAIGLAALSTAASFARCTSDLTKDYGEVMQHAWHVAHRSYWAAVELSKLNYDEAFIFNGRHAISRPFSECLQNAGCRLRYYEFDAAREGYFVFEDSIHSTAAIAKRVQEHQPNRELGIAFFERNKSRAEGTDSRRFTGRQKVGHIPRGMEPGMAVTFFTSSPDEFFAIKDDPDLSEDFPNQFNVALHLANECARLDRQFVLRLHPHLQWKHASWRAEWDFKALRQFGTKIIYPEDDYDSYGILERSMAVVTCGSTIGIEAAYHGIPSAVVGDFFSARLGCVLPTPTKASLSQFLQSPSQSHDARELAIRYGSYVLSRGEQITGLQRTARMLRIEGKLVSPSLSLIAPLRQYLRRISPA